MFRRILCSANATAFVFLAIVTAASVAQERPGGPPPTTEKLPNNPSQAVSTVAPKTPVDVLINEINNELKMSRRAVSGEQFNRAHTNIATLISDLRRVSPDDPHVAKFLPERWLSLKYLVPVPSTNGKSRVERMRELNNEIDEVLNTSFLDFPGLRQFEAAALEVILPRVTVAIRLIVEASPLSFAGSYRFWLVIAVASTTALLLVTVRQRSEAATVQRFSKVRQWILSFLLTGASCFAVDAYLISRQSAEVARRVVQDYPDSLRGRLAQGQIRQRERIGEPFELEFTDAISGRAVSIKKMRGKVVVVEFWATSCGPCIREIPELKRLYAKYHDQGVEFIGVSLDPPENEGGLEKLKSFIDKEQIPWPQYYLGQDNYALVTGSATDDFSESWGIDGIPAAFVIDRRGNLYSTKAWGRLDTLIPLLLRE